MYYIAQEIGCVYIVYNIGTRIPLWWECIDEMSN